MTESAAAAANSGSNRSSSSGSGSESPRTRCKPGFSMSATPAQLAISSGATLPTKAGMTIGKTLRCPLTYLLPRLAAASPLVQLQYFHRWACYSYPDAERKPFHRRGLLVRRGRAGTSTIFTIIIAAVVVHCHFVTEGRRYRIERRCQFSSPLQTF